MKVYYVRVILCVLILASPIFANDRRFVHPSLAKRQSTSQSQIKRDDSSAIFFVGIEGQMYNAMLKHTIEGNGSDTSQISKESGFGGALKVGIVDMPDFIGGRFYAEGSYMGLRDFNVFTLGLNVDMMINFIDSNIWNIGVFAGVGGGMYVAFFKNPALNSNAKVPLSPTGWLNLGLRFTIFKNQGIELTYRLPYIYAPIYKDTQTPVGSSSSITTSYLLKSGYFGFGYTLAF